MPELKNENILDMFGLTYEQTLLLFSTEKMITEFDMSITDNKKGMMTLKGKWLYEWEQSIKKYLDKFESDQKSQLLSPDELRDAYKAEIQKSENNLTWYYIIILELITFEPYTPLADDNRYKKCAFDDKRAYVNLKNFFVSHGVVGAEKIERMLKAYNRSLAHNSGHKGLTRTLVVFALTAVATAVAAVAAGPIAVAVLGPAFEGLHGIALVNACLALAGGGAVAAGGAGIAGGVAVIAGGGALLGMAGGGVYVGADMLFSSPDLTLSQTAKLETILKEVTLNAQKDVVAAQQVMKQYAEQISELTKKLTLMELENETNKKEIENLKQSIEYMTKSYKALKAFKSAYETGKETEIAVAEEKEDGEK